jgi:PfaD family protein
MAPAADMFEQGVKVQVLKRGTLFAMRGLKMHEFYRSRSGLDDLSDDDVKWLEDVMGESLETAWTEVVAFMRDTNPAELERAEADPKKKMALVFRRYLFMGSQWARDGADDRRSDFQIWCGPSMGAFNEWVSGSFLEPLDARTIRQIAWNLMEGAACITRAAQLRSFGVAVPGDAFDYRPREFG